MSPQLKTVEAIGHEMLSRKSRPYLIQPEDFFTTAEALKHRFAELINAGEAKRIALIPSASYGLANAAANVPLAAGQKIIVAGDQFPSNYYIWQRKADEKGGRVVVVPAPGTLPRAAVWNTAILEAIDDNTAVVALPHTHWADGTRFDLQAIGEKSRRVGALLIIDGTQSVGALPFDAAQIQPDALICAGYKWLMGPYATGLAYYGPHFDDGRPIEENWINRRDSEDFQHLTNYQEAYQPLAGRYSVGEHSNFILTPMLHEAIQQLLEWGVSNIQNYCEDISTGPIDRLKEMGCSVEEASGRGHHLFGVRLQDRFDIDKLRNQFGKNRVHVSLRGDAIRISPHVYNDGTDFERLIGCFETARKKIVH